MHQAHTRHANTPEYHRDRQKDRWTEPLEENLGQWLENTVRHKEDCQGHVVLVAGHVEVFSKTFNLRIPDVGSVY